MADGRRGGDMRRGESASTTCGSRRNMPSTGLKTSAGSAKRAFGRDGVRPRPAGPTRAAPGGDDSPAEDPRSAKVGAGPQQAEHRHELGLVIVAVGVALSSEHQLDTGHGRIGACSKVV